MTEGLSSADSRSFPCTGTDFQPSHRETETEGEAKKCFFFCLQEERHYLFNLLIQWALYICSNVPALQSFTVTPVLGNFRDKHKAKQHDCSSIFPTHKSDLTERSLFKLTGLNIRISMIHPFAIQCWNRSKTLWQ